ncbi:flavodoxin family protein [Methanolacinia paynteri]|uniref:flavodoxin family protein n=1 Tax=Methanolacinia paynteri TaxID=230356 RepID=UPI000A051369|nr:flavodoxin family protein [Methanolacinia paynteri]
MKNIKVLGLNASPRGKDSNTLRLTNAVLAGANEEGAKTELIDLYTKHIEYCTACGTCYAKGDCNILDDFSDIFDSIMNADGIVLGAPNYIDCVPAPMKALFDRMADAIHCQMLTGKIGCSVCTAGGSGENEVVGYMNKTLSTLGANIAGSVGVALGRDPSNLAKAETEARTLGKTLVKAVRGEIAYPDQDELHRQKRKYFCQLITNNRDRFAHEYDWYEKMGWLENSREDP